MDSNLTDVFKFRGYPYNKENKGYKINNLKFSDGCDLYSLVLWLYLHKKSPAKVFNIVYQKAINDNIELGIDIREFCLIKNRLERKGLLHNGK